MNPIKFLKRYKKGGERKRRWFFNGEKENVIVVITIRVSEVLTLAWQSSAKWFLRMISLEEVEQ